MHYEKIKLNSKRWLSTKSLLNEKWENINGFEGIYQISNYGRVKSLKRENKYIGANQCSTHKHLQLVEEKILKSGFDKDGYVQNGLSLKGKTKTKRVHTLVADAFLNVNELKYMYYEDPNKINANNIVINHKNEDKTDNRFFNLEYCTIAYNNAYGSRSKPINQYTKDGKFVKTWQNAVEAAEALGLKQSSNIASCCKHKLHCNTLGGYKWEYAEVIKDEVKI